MSRITMPAALQLAAQEVAEGRSRRSIHDQLAVLFAEELSAEIGRDNMAALAVFNEDTEECNADDFCDANQIMLEAFEEVMGFEYRSGCAEEEGAASEQHLWNDTRLTEEARTIAKRLYIPLFRTPSLGSRPAND